MARPLPASLSPQICILSSPDLSDLLEKSSLPPLPHILQSFAPLPQITTRTTTLVSVPHSSFHLRFTDLIETEEACREDEEQRAIRTIDWMTARINKRCTKWVHDIELAGDKETLRTPWWDELRRCSEGDFVPAKTESWNHPVALILAVSTMAPNPLNSITAMHARSVQFPAWVDTNFLRYTLIIHPRNSPLTDEEATALFNAVKKQFGLHTYLLALGLPQTPPPPVPVPALLPRLPPPPSPDGAPHQSPVPPSPIVGNGPVINTLRMEDADIQQTGRFTREFLVMSLIPWMEKCVIDWNENFSSTRRLPSRLFSSTRRLFGSQSSAPTTPISNTPVQGRSSTSSLNGSIPVISQQRRLAEFSTILGDYKLATAVWESLRKESKGGSDILPLLLAPGPTVPLHAQSALSSIYQNASDIPPHVQLRALSYSVRWEAGIPPPDFSSNVLEGERWLVWASSNAEEAPSALLLAHAALLSVKKKAIRRAALWYVLAANRLEKCGIKPLTMYFLRKAQDLYHIKIPKELSPSFWDSEGKSPNTSEGLEEILSGIEHPLGRLLYTTGDVAGAVKLFLKLLRGSSSFSNAGLPMLGDGSLKAPVNDKIYLDDFKVAYSYWKSTNLEQVASVELQVPIKFCTTKESRLRFPDDNLSADSDVWIARQEDWTSFLRTRGDKTAVIPGGKVSTDELFWMDLWMRNPLDAEMKLTNVTLIVTEDTSRKPESEDKNVEVEVINEVILGPKAYISVPISMKAKRPATLLITHAKYEFLGQLPVLESLSSRGRRLHDTPLQRQQPTYAPDQIIRAKVVATDNKLDVRYAESGPLTLLQGQNKQSRLWLTNSGTRPIGEIWLVSGADDEISLGSGELFGKLTMSTEKITFANSLKPAEPLRVALSSSADNETWVLQPADNLEVPFVIHDEAVGKHELCILFVFRENDTQPFRTTKFVLPYRVLPILDLSISAEPSQGSDYLYALNIDLNNTSSTNAVDISQITTLSPRWSCHSLTNVSCTVAPLQHACIHIGASPWLEGHGSAEASSFVARKLETVLKGAEVGSSMPPSIDMQCCHISESPSKISLQSERAVAFIHNSRQKYVSSDLSRVHSYISSASYPFIFPLYNPNALDVIIFWEIPSQHISGYVSAHGLVLGAGHAALEEILEEAENAKAKRSMYAETRRENIEILDAIRGSDWNMEMNPLSVALKNIAPQSHDFSAGPCRVPVDFQLRNHSLQLPVKYVLKLNASQTSSANSSYTQPPYLGRLTFRGTIPPTELTVVQPHLWISSPGTYAINGWALESEITVPSKDDGNVGRKRRYLQDSQDSTVTIVVSNEKNSACE